MKQLITQIKYFETAEFSRKGSVLCTLTNEKEHEWNCEVSQMSLDEIAHFIVEFFNSTSVTAQKLKFTFFKKTVTIFKSSSAHNYSHYLEQICDSIVIE